VDVGRLNNNEAGATPCSRRVVVNKLSGGDTIRRGEVPHHGRHDDPVSEFHHADITRAEKMCVILIHLNLQFKWGIFVEIFAIEYITIRLNNGYETKKRAEVW
jgi:hypothetical protein